MISQERIKLIGNELDFSIPKGTDLEPHWAAVAEKLDVPVSEVQAVHIWLVYKINCGVCI